MWVCVCVIMPRCIHIATITFPCQTSSAVSSTLQIHAIHFFLTPIIIATSRSRAMQRATASRNSFLFSLHFLLILFDSYSPYRYVCVCVTVECGFAYFYSFIRSLKWFLLAYVVCHAFIRQRMSTVLPACKSFLYLFCCCCHCARMHILQLVAVVVVCRYFSFV